MSDNDSVSSERSYIVRRKIRTNEEILQDLNAEVDISDGEYESDWSVGVDTDTDDEFDYSSQSNTNSPGQERLFITGTRMALSRMDSKTDLSKLEVNKIFTAPINKQVAEPNVPAENSCADDSMENMEELIREEIRLMEEETARKRKELRELLQPTDQQNNDGRKSRMRAVMMVKPTERTCIGTKSEPQMPTNINHIEPSAACSRSYNLGKTSTTVFKPTQRIKPVYSGNMVQPTCHPPRSDTPAFSRSYKRKHLDDAKKMDNTLRQAFCDESMPGTTIVEQADITAHDLGVLAVASHGTLKYKTPLTAAGSVSAGDKRVRFRIDRPFEKGQANLKGTSHDLNVRHNSQSHGDQLATTTTTEQDKNKRGVLKSIRKQLSRFGRFIRRKLKRNTTVSPIS